MKQKKQPKPPKPAPMPDQDDLDAERRKKLAVIAQRGGRQSTIMSDAGFPGAETLG